MPDNHTPQRVYHYRSSAITNSEIEKPNANNLNFGEIAINYNAQEPSLFIKQNDSEIAQFVDKKYIEDNINSLSGLNDVNISSPMDEQSLVYDSVNNKYINKYALAGAIPYGRCDSSSTATNFTATVPGITELKDGTCMLLKNGVVNSASGFKINVNGLGAKPVYNNLAAATLETTLFNSAYTILFIYDETRVSGGCWIYYRGYYISDSNSIGYQLRTNSSTRKMSDVTYRYRLLFSNEDESEWVPANTSTSTNATTKRNVNQRHINPFGRIVYYGTTASVPSGSTPSASYLWDQYGISLGYSFNRTGAALVLSYPAPVYVKCAPQADGSAIIDSTTPYVQTLPSTDDGKIYIYLGMAYSATNIELEQNHPVFYYDGTGIRVWTGKRPFSGDYSDLTNKPTIPTVNDSTITIQKNGTNVDSFTLNQSSNKTINITVPTKTSDLSNDSNFITSAVTAMTKYATSANVVTALSGKANTSDIKDSTITIQKNGSTVKSFTLNQATGETINITVPTDVSDLANGSGYITSADTKDFITSAVTKLKFFATSSDTVTALNGKQATISDLAKIRSDAASGYSAYQTLTGHVASASHITSTERTNWNKKIDSGVTAMKNFATSANVVTALSGKANTGDIKNSTITIQTNSNTVDTFTLNQSSNKTINIPIPTDVSDFTNDAGFITSAVTNLSNYASSGDVVTALSNKVDKETGKGLSTNDYTTEEKNKLSGIQANAQVNGFAFKTVNANATAVTATSSADTITFTGGTNISLTATGNATTKKIQISATGLVPTGITVNGKNLGSNITLSASDVSALTNTTKYAASIDLTKNNTTFQYTWQLKDQDGNNLGDAQTLDLPLESVVVSGKYIASAKTVQLVLQSGSTIEFSIADLVSGLQTEITSSNMLSADLIQNGTTNKVYTATEQTKLSDIEANAQKNGNAYKTIKVDGTNMSAGNSGDTFSISAGTNITLTTGTKGVKISAPSNVSAFSNDAGYITSAATNLSNYASSASVVSALDNKPDYAFKTIKVAGTDIVADAKEDTLTITAGANIGLVPNATNDSFIISATDTTYSDATTSVHGLMSVADKKKLNGIASGAQVNVQSDWNATSGDAFIKNKPTIGNGALTITTATTGMQLGNFSANQSTNTTVKLHKVAATGNYTDLTNKPTIGNGQITIQTGATPSLGSFSANQTGNTTITLPKVAGTGSYNDLSDKPDLYNFITSAVTAMTNYATSANVVTELNKKNETFECVFTFTPNQGSEEAFPKNCTITCNKTTSEIASAVEDGKIVIATSDLNDLFGISGFCKSYWELTNVFDVEMGDEESNVPLVMFSVEVFYGVANVYFKVYGMLSWIINDVVYSEDLQKLTNLKSVATGGTLDDLDDAVIYNSTSGQVLQYNGSEWVNETLPSIPDVSNFITSAVTDLQFFATSSSTVNALATHAASASHITTSERTTWNGKQDAISDLAQIRSNAASGYSAYTGFTAHSANTTIHLTSAEKTKLDGIESGAEVNVQSDWNVTDSSSDAYIQNKPTKLSDFTNDSMFITSAVTAMTNYATSANVVTALSGKTSQTINVTHSQLRQLKNNSALIPGQSYRITDYTTKTKRELTNISAAGHDFDIVVVANSISTLDCKAKAVQHSGDTYFNADALLRWQIWYDIENEINRYNWADYSTGKGVIYRMIDEIGNDCPYDFKNILFSISGKPANAYTFTLYKDGECSDFSVMYNGSRCRNNIIKKSYGAENLSRTMKLGFNVFYLTNEHGISSYNFLDCECQNNVFSGDSISFNILERYCYNNNIYGTKNHFSINCHDNTLLYGCMNNIFATSCSNNILSSHTSNNIFENECTNNTLGNKCSYNTFGNGCQFNTLGDNSNANTFGNYSTNITFGNGSNQYGTFIENVIIGNGCGYIKLYNSDTANQNNILQNISIAPGVKGTISNNIEISTISRNLAYATKVARNSKGELKIYNEADLVL